VFANWSSVFRGIPDFSSDLVASSVDGETEWGEWDWRGHHPTDGTSFVTRGITVLIVCNDLVAEARLYMEPVDLDGENIASAVQELYKPPVQPGP
jgi:hypothetical protein